MGLRYFCQKVKLLTNSKTNLVRLSTYLKTSLVKLSTNWKRQKKLFDLLGWKLQVRIVKHVNKWQPQCKIVKQKNMTHSHSGRLPDCVLKWFLQEPYSVYKLVVPHSLIYENCGHPRNNFITCYRSTLEYLIAEQDGIREQDGPLSLKVKRAGME